MSGLSRTPGKRVWVNSPPRVRIPPSPPNRDPSDASHLGFFLGGLIDCIGVGHRIDPPQVMHRPR